MTIPSDATDAQAEMDARRWFQTTEYTEGTENNSVFSVFSVVNEIKAYLRLKALVTVTVSRQSCPASSLRESGKSK